MKSFILMTFFLVGIQAQFSAQAIEGENRTYKQRSEGPQEGNNQHDDEHYNNEEETTHIEDSMADKVGIGTAHVSSHILQQRIIAYGSLNTDPGQLSQVQARYSGVIKSVKSTLGDEVKPGDLLAEVESSESLKIYQLRAPIAGTIIQRKANTGEVTLDRVLFTIANFNSLWAEFRIYPSQQPNIAPGQDAYIVAKDIELRGSVQHIIPVLNKPYQLARVVFDNRHQRLTPGVLVEGHIVVGEFTAELAVEKDAIQSMGERTGVFIKLDEEYAFVPLQLGRSDDQYIEVLSGLSPGQVYVSENSYLVKADIKKSEAEDDD